MTDWTKEQVDRGAAALLAQEASSNPSPGAEVLAVLNAVFPDGPEPEAEIYRQALLEIRDRSWRAADARAVARRVLGE